MILRVLSVICDGAVKETMLTDLVRAVEDSEKFLGVYLKSGGARVSCSRLCVSELGHVMGRSAHRDCVSQGLDARVLAFIELHFV